MTQRMDSNSFRPLLSRLVQTPEFFTPRDLQFALEHCFEKDLIPPAQIGAFLTALHMHRLERRPEFLAAAARLLRERALKADVQGVGEDEFVVDIVGTGGDGYNLFNVSTAAGIVAAGAGARVLKHGSRASTSSSGSADLLESLGCSFAQPTLTIPKLPFTFILAPHFHPSLATLAPHRKALPFRTMFNILGPLINPAKPKGMLLGVAEAQIGSTFARSLREGGVVHAMVVCGFEGLDEISCAGPSRVWEVREGEGGPHGDDVVERVISPEDFGLPTHPLNDVAGGSPAENAETFKRLMKCEGKIPAELEAVADFVCLNAGALLVVARAAKDFKEGARMARESILSGKAWEAFEMFREKGLQA